MEIPSAIEYRQRAKSHLESAKNIIDTNSLYACLELRYCIECVVFARVRMSLKELENEDLFVWEPRKIIDLILEIDDTAGSDITISVQFHDEQPFQEIGTEKRLSLKWIKKYYNSLGSFLHIRTLRQEKIANADAAEIARIKCEEIVPELERVLSSEMWFAGNFIPGYSFKCECGAQLSRSQSAIDRGRISCGTCGETFECRIEHGKIKMRVAMVQWQCLCGNKRQMKYSELVEARENGSTISCVVCGVQARVYSGFEIKQSNPAS